MKQPRIGLPGSTNGPTLRQVAEHAARDGADNKHAAELAMQHIQAMAVILVALEGAVELPDAEALELVRGIVHRTMSIVVVANSERGAVLDVKQNGLVVRRLEVARPVMAMAQVPG